MTFSDNRQEFAPTPSSMAPTARKIRYEVQLEFGLELGCQQSWAKLVNKLRFESGQLFVRVMVPAFPQDTLEERQSRIASYVARAQRLLEIES